MLAYVKEKYLKWSGLTYPQIIDKVYRQPLANRFLAGISLFIKENLKCYELRDLVIYNFQCFFEKNVLCYPRILFVLFLLLEEWLLHLRGN